MNVLHNFVVVTILYYIHISDHYVYTLNLHNVIVNYISLKLEKIKKPSSLHFNCQLLLPGTVLLFISDG